VKTRTVKTAFLLLAFTLTVHAAPRPLTPNQLLEANAKAQTLFIDCTDAHLNRLARFTDLRVLSITGAYNSNL